LNFEAEKDGRIAVCIHQVVQDRGGRTIVDTTVSHVYRIEDGLIVSMEIRAETRPVEPGFA
jgi:hypothetical protein